MLFFMGILATVAYVSTGVLVAYHYLDGDRETPATVARIAALWPVLLLVEAGIELLGLVLYGKTKNSR